VTRARLARYALLGTLYFAQGLPFGFFVQALPSLLRKAGYTLIEIGWASLLVAPWALKFLWAPIVDRRYWRRLGLRRTWILAMQLAATLVLGTLAVVPGSDALSVLMAAMLVLNLIAATQDIATDGMAVAKLPESERGFANGLQVAGYRVGMIVGGGVLVGMLGLLGQHGTFAIMAVLTALASIPVVLAPEPAVPVVLARGSDVSGAGTLTAAAPMQHFLKRPGAWRLITLVSVYKAGEAFAQGMLRPFFIDIGLELEDIGWLLGTVGFPAGMLGAVIGGVLVNRIGRRRALLWFGVGQVVTVAAYAYLAFGTPTWPALVACVFIEHLASGMATAALFTAMMDWSRPEAAGTDYTVQASAVVIATFVASVASGISAQGLGYGPHFVLAAVLCVVAIGVVAKLFPQDNVR
jgi:RhtX/FptX family siderophore transporter